MIDDIITPGGDLITVNPVRTLIFLYNSSDGRIQFFINY